MSSRVCHGNVSDLASRLFFPSFLTLKNTLNPYKNTQRRNKNNNINENDNNNSDNKTHSTSTKVGYVESKVIWSRSWQVDKSNYL